MALAPRRQGTRSAALHAALTQLRQARDTHAPLPPDDARNNKLISVKTALARQDLAEGAGLPAAETAAQAKAAAVRVKTSKTQRAAAAKYEALLGFAQAYERKIDSRLAALRAENKALLSAGEQAVLKMMVRRLRPGLQSSSSCPFVYESSSQTLSQDAKKGKNTTTGVGSDPISQAAGSSLRPGRGRGNARWGHAAGRAPRQATSSSISTSSTAGTHTKQAFRTAPSRSHPSSVAFHSGVNGPAAGAGGGPKLSRVGSSRLSIGSRGSSSAGNRQRGLSVDTASSGGFSGATSDASEGDEGGGSFSPPPCGSTPSANRLRHLLRRAARMKPQQRAAHLVELLLARSSVVQEEGGHGQTGGGQVFIQLDPELRQALMAHTATESDRLEAESTLNSHLRGGMSTDAAIQREAIAAGGGKSSKGPSRLSVAISDSLSPRASLSSWARSSAVWSSRNLHSTGGKAPNWDDEKGGEGGGDAKPKPPSDASAHPSSGSSRASRLVVTLGKGASGGGDGSAGGGEAAHEADTGSDGDSDTASTQGAMGELMDALTMLAVASAAGGAWRGTGGDLGISLGGGINLSGPAALGLGSGFDQNELAQHRTHMPDEVAHLPIDDAQSDDGTPPGTEDPLVELPPAVWGEVHAYMAEPDGGFQTARRKRIRASQREQQKKQGVLWGRPMPPAYAESTGRPSSASSAASTASHRSTASRIRSARQSPAGEARPVMRPTPPSPRSPEGGDNTPSASLAPTSTRGGTRNTVSTSMREYFSSAAARDAATERKVDQLSKDRLERARKHVAPGKLAAEQRTMQRAAQAAAHVARGASPPPYMSYDGGAGSPGGDDGDPAVAQLLQLGSGDTGGVAASDIIAEIVRVTGAPPSKALQEQLRRRGEHGHAGGEDAAGQGKRHPPGAMAAVPCRQDAAAQRRQRAAARQARGLGEGVAGGVAVAELQLAQRLARRLVHRAHSLVQSAQRHASSSAAAQEAAALKQHYAMYPVGGAGGVDAWRALQQAEAEDGHLLRSRGAKRGSLMRARRLGGSKPPPRPHTASAAEGGSRQRGARAAHKIRSMQEAASAVSAVTQLRNKYSKNTAAGNSTGRQGHLYGRRGKGHGSVPASYLFRNAPPQIAAVSGAWGTALVLPAVQVARLSQLVHTLRLEAREDGEELAVEGLVDWREGAVEGGEHGDAPPRSFEDDGLGGGLRMTRGGDDGEVMLAHGGVGAGNAPLPDSMTRQKATTSAHAPSVRSKSTARGAQPRALEGKLDIRVSEHCTAKGGVPSEVFATALSATLQQRLQARSAQAQQTQPPQAGPAAHEEEAISAVREDSQASDGGNSVLSEAFSVSKHGHTMRPLVGSRRVGALGESATELQRQHTESGATIRLAAREMAVSVPLWDDIGALRSAVSTMTRAHRSEKAKGRAPPPQRPGAGQADAQAMHACVDAAGYGAALQGTVGTHVPGRTASLHPAARPGTAPARVPMNAHLGKDGQARTQAGDVGISGRSLGVPVAVSALHAEAPLASPFVALGMTPGEAAAPHRKLHPPAANKRRAQGARVGPIVPTPVDGRLGQVWSGSEGGIKRILTAQRMHDVLEGRTGPPVIPHSMFKGSAAADEAPPDVAAARQVTEEEGKQSSSGGPFSQNRGGVRQQEIAQLDAAALAAAGGVRGAGPRRGGRGGAPPVPLGGPVPDEEAGQTPASTEAPFAFGESLGTHTAAPGISLGGVQGGDPWNPSLPEMSLLSDDSILQAATAAPVSQLKRMRIEAEHKAEQTRHSFALHASQVSGFAVRRPHVMPPLHTLDSPTGGDTAPRLLRLTSASSTGSSGGTSALKRRLVFRPPSFAVKRGASMGLGGRASRALGSASPSIGEVGEGEGDDSDLDEDAADALTLAGSPTHRGAAGGGVEIDAEGGSTSPTSGSSPVPGSKAGSLTAFKFRKLLAVSGAIEQLSSLVGSRGDKGGHIRSDLLRVAKIANAGGGTGASAGGPGEAVTIADVQAAAEQLAAAEVAGAVRVGGHVHDPVLGSKVVILVDARNDASAVVGRMRQSDVYTEQLRAPLSVLAPYTPQDEAEGVVDTGDDLDPFGIKTSLRLPPKLAAEDPGAYCLERRQWTSALHARARTAVQQQLYERTPWWERPSPGDEAAALMDAPPTPPLEPIQGQADKPAVARGKPPRPGVAVQSPPLGPMQGGGAPLVSSPLKGISLQSPPRTGVKSGGGHLASVPSGGSALSAASSGGASAANGRGGARSDTGGSDMTALEDDLAGLNLEGILGGGALAVSASSVASSLVNRLRGGGDLMAYYESTASSQFPQLDRDATGLSAGGSMAAVNGGPFGGAGGPSLSQHRRRGHSNSGRDVSRDPQGAHAQQAVYSGQAQSDSMVALASVASSAGGLGGSDSASSHLHAVTALAGDGLQVGVSRDVMSAEQRQAALDAAATNVTSAQRLQFAEAAHLKAEQKDAFRARHTHRRAEAMPRAIADAIQYRLTGRKPHTRAAAVQLRKAARTAVRGYQKAQETKAAAAAAEEARNRRVKEGAEAAVADVMSDIAMTRRRHVHRAAFAVKDRPAHMQGEV